MAPARARSSQAERFGQRARRRATALIVYFDTSALIKTLVEEDGSELADELWLRASSRLASHLVYPEARAALTAAERAGRIDRPSRRTAVKGLDGACSAMRLIGVDWELAVSAGKLAERYALRGYDAVHLATVLAAQSSDLLLATWDLDLARAAVSAGQAVVPS